MEYTDTYKAVKKHWLAHTRSLYIDPNPSNPKAIGRKLIKMLDYLPYEIQSQIMKRLPVKSLTRLKSVSKAWKSFIRSSEFITDYNACHPQQHSLLVTYTNYNYKEKHVLIVDDDTFPLRKLSHTQWRS